MSDVALLLRLDKLDLDDMSEAEQDFVSRQLERYDGCESQDEFRFTERQREWAEKILEKYS